MTYKISTGELVDILVGYTLYVTPESVGDELAQIPFTVTELEDSYVVGRFEGKEGDVAFSPELIAKVVPSSPPIPTPEELDPAVKEAIERIAPEVINALVSEAVAAIITPDQILPLIKEEAPNIIRLELVNALRKAADALEASQ